MLQIDRIFKRYQVPPEWKVTFNPTEKYIVLLITEGSIKYEIAGETMLLRAKDLIYIPIETLRGAWGCPPEYHKMFAAHFLIDPAAAPFSFMKDNKYTKISVQNFDYLKNRFSVLYDLWNERLLHYELYCEAVLMEIMVLFDREMELNRHSPRKLETVQKVKELINSRYRDSITLDDMAEYAERSPNYICNLFQEIVGQSPIQYLNQTRVMAARELLVNTDWSVTDIALHVGFSDAYYFNRVYKKIVGLPPRKSIME